MWQHLDEVGASDVGGLVKHLKPFESVGSEGYLKQCGPNKEGIEQQNSTIVPAEKITTRKFQKSPIVEAVIRQLHEASNAAGMPYDKPRQVINDVAVLYAQAVKINTHFQVERWSTACKGKLPDSQQLVAKRRKRAIQELWRTYRGDAARLIDLCRSSITVETTEDLAACLKAILEDPECAVLQIKNRFTASHDSRTTAGYRNVSLSLIIVDRFTMTQGIDAHVCELQLGFGPFEFLKKFLNGHRRYVEFRDARAE